MTRTRVVAPTRTIAQVASKSLATSTLMSVTVPETAAAVTVMASDKMARWGHISA